MLSASSVASAPATVISDDKVIDKPDQKKLADTAYRFNRFLEKLQSLDTRASVPVWLM